MHVGNIVTATVTTFVAVTVLQAFRFQMYYGYGYDTVTVTTRLRLRHGYGYGTVTVDLTLEIILTIKALGTLAIEMGAGVPQNHLRLVGHTRATVEARVAVQRLASRKFARIRCFERGTNTAVLAVLLATWAISSNSVVEVPFLARLAVAEL